eukprot:COSAG01_NODE_56_length_31088_cov_39.354771_8_plen_112_part_00
MRACSRQRASPAPRADDAAQRHERISSPAPQLPTRGRNHPKTLTTGRPRELKANGAYVKIRRWEGPPRNHYEYESASRTAYCLLAGCSLDEEEATKSESDGASGREGGKVP